MPKCFVRFVILYGSSLFKFLRYLISMKKSKEVFFFIFFHKIFKNIFRYSSIPHSASHHPQVFEYLKNYEEKCEALKMQVKSILH